MERNTRQRTAISAVIALAQRPLLPQEVLEAAKSEAPGLGIATVYRNLKSLLEDGLLQEVKLPGENPRYETAGHPHHHHFQCMQCQRVFDVHACPGDLSRLAPKGFTVEAHDLTLYGKCADCYGNAPLRQPTEAVAHGHTHRL
jgi:Fur family ferric uptake transcriptional regulator